MSKPNFSYKSHIKVHGCPLLPPLIDHKLRREIKKYKDDAVALEHELSLKKISESERHSEPSDETLNQSVDLDGCSEGTIKLIEYIKKALKDVPHDRNVEQLQNQFFDDLKKYECAKSIAEGSKASSSCDTLHNLETFSTDREELKEFRLSQHETQSNTSSGGETLSPENHDLPDNSLIIDCEGESTENKSESHTPIRRKSFTLESPSPALIRYFQSLTKDANTETEVNSTSITRKSSKNLNELWDNDSNYLDMSTMSNKSDLSNLPRDVPVDNRSLNHSQNLINISKSGQDYVSEQATTPKSYSSPEKLLPKRNGPYSSKVYTLKEEKAAVRIQAGIRSYLIRRLLRTNKVVDLKKIICDSVVCAKKLHMEQSVTQADVTLHVRLIRQVTAACFELHNIFFEWPIKEQMTLIRQDRIMTIRALARKRLSSSEIMSKSEMRSSPVTRQLVSPRSGEPIAGMSASFTSGSSSSRENQSWS